MLSLLRRSHAIHNKENTYEEFRPSPGEGHGIPSPMETKNAIYNMKETVDKYAPSLGEGHGIPSPMETKMQFITWKKPLINLRLALEKVIICHAPLVACNKD